ncbi:MAG: hypothetical protein V1799_11760 [bacterium]
MIEDLQNNIGLLQSELNRLIGQHNQLHREIEFARRNNLSPAAAERKIASLDKIIERLKSRTANAHFLTPQLDFNF